ncbi:MAG: hypothetical protein N2443_08070 [Blastocatellia bacterium]|nr:hypothetical protein [Blastocatellia bacterium]MCX7752811.1 hypothetical protein [Blastocatellia bacterium]MDW8167545.1 glycosyltransferase family 9 protein [Acidobacteriota bacterium]MDW8256146.1 glycosyltransferase family 9 protein [Acidobacteriota bacterium]
MRPVSRARTFSRILLLHWGRMSDVVFALPACAALRERFPEARITAFATSWGGELLALSGAVSDIWLIRSERPAEWLLPWNMWEVLHAVREFRRRRYELAVDFRPSRETILLALAARVPVRLAALSPEGLAGAFFNVWRRPDDPQRHRADRYLDALRALDITPTARVPALRTDPATDERFERWLRARGVETGELLVGIAPEADPGAAMWPLERFLDLTHRLVQHFRIRPIDVGRSAWGRARAPRGILSWRARSLRELASALARCTLVVSGDGGPGHLAAALGVPTLMLGCARTRRPLGEEHRFVEREALAACSTERVFEIASEMLGRSRTAALFRS